MWAPCQNIFIVIIIINIQYLRGNQTVKIEDLYLGMLHDVSKFIFHLHFHVQVLFNLYISMQTDQIHICMQTTPVRVQVTGLIKLKATKMRIQELKRVEKGVKVQRNKGQSTTCLTLGGEVSTTKGWIARICKSTGQTLSTNWRQSIITTGTWKTQKEVKNLAYKYKEHKDWNRK